MAAEKHAAATWNFDKSNFACLCLKPTLWILIREMKHSLSVQAL
jgi:hypothetical protein